MLEPCERSSRQAPEPAGGWLCQRAGGPRRRSGPHPAATTRPNDACAVGKGGPRKQDADRPARRDKRASGACRFLANSLVEAVVRARSRPRSQRHADHRQRDQTCAAAIAQERAWRVACAIACEERRGGGASAPSRVPFSLFGTIGPCRCRPLATGVVVAWSTSAARSRGRLFVPRPSLPSCGACCQLSLCRSRFPLRSPTQSWGQP